MPELQPVFEELRQRMSLHEDVFRRSDNPTDANGPRSRTVDDLAPDTSYPQLGAAKGREMYADQGWLATPST